MPRYTYAKKVEIALPNGIEVIRIDQKYATVRVRIEDLPRLRILKLPEAVREYQKEVQRRYRKRLKERRKS